MSIYSGKEKQTQNKKKQEQKSKLVQEPENLSAPISTILTYIKEFYISFQDIELTDKEIDIDNIQKIIIPKNTIYKIFQLLDISKSRMIPYILFSFTSVESEIVSNTIKIHKIDYEKLLKFADFFYILTKKNIEIKIAKKSILKIFELLQLSINERLNIIQFLQIYEEKGKEKKRETKLDEKNDIDTSAHKPKTKNLKSKKAPESAKKGKKKNKHIK